MAIRRVGAKRKRYATRTANPRKKRKTTSRRRKAAAPKRRRRRRSNPGTKKGMVRKTARRAYRKRSNPAPRRRRNSAKKQKPLFKLAGVDMGVVALGTVSAVVIKNGLNKLPGISNLIGMLPASLQPLASPALVIGTGWAIHKYAKNPMLKKVGAYAAVAALVLAVDDFAEKQIGSMFGGTWSTSMSGGWQNVGGMHTGMNGMHMDVGTGGAYVALPNPQHIGAKSMFGGITNLA